MYLLSKFYSLFIQKIYYIKLNFDHFIFVFQLINNYILKFF